MDSGRTKRYIFLGLTAGLGFAAILGVVLILRNREDKRVGRIGKAGQIDLSSFDSPDQPGSGACMDKTFITMLQKVQQKTGLPIFEWINSGARSEYWNRKVGGVKNSAHKMPACKAADIKTPTKAIRDQLIHAAKEVGFTRIGIGKTFIHLDNDESKPQYVAWGYTKGQRPPLNPFA